MPENDPRQQLRRDMLRGIITEPLLSEIGERLKERTKKERDKSFPVIIVLNETANLVDARQAVENRLSNFPCTHSGSYIFSTMPGEAILTLAAWNRDFPGKSPIYRIWKDQEIQACLTQSRVTIKADAAQRAFDAVGNGICWAVLDSGVDKTHDHFKHHSNIPTSDWHDDFVDPTTPDPFNDAFGHGTHVAGIIAGFWQNTANEDVAFAETLKDIGQGDTLTIAAEPVPISTISGIAPATKIISMRVLDAQGRGRVSSVLQAIQKIQTINDFGRRLALPNASIHGVNLSLGYDFNPRWFGCGQSPLCVEVNRLVRSGVVVVVSAGNDGYNALSRTDQGAQKLGYHLASINDPGNADLAITVGSTHREQPHTFGVSYFSSRGPTGDGRLKPDLVAPGEHIFSCAAGKHKTDAQSLDPRAANIRYLEQSGTSMAAPHVSGAIAAFLSVRREFIGQPETVKKLFLENSTDLHREPYSQGRGLVDLMRVLQAV
ncbi:MAG: hypothetical protein RL328_2169 [Acidobacteriota bacterium]|jgi:subtilisin family serine protease